MALITSDMKIAELAEKFPQAVNYLIYEYGFHCVGCFVSEFESLVDGARVHGIVDEDYDNLLSEINEIADKESKAQ